MALDLIGVVILVLVLVGRGRNCVMFVADLSSSSHANNKKIILLSFVKILCKE